MRGLSLCCVKIWLRLSRQNPKCLITLLRSAGAQSLIGDQKRGDGGPLSLQMKQDEDHLQLPRKLLSAPSRREQEGNASHRFFVGKQ